MKQFVKAFRRHLNYYPNTHDDIIRVGSYGHMTAKGFKKEGDLDFEFKTERVNKRDRGLIFDDNASMELLLDADAKRVAGTTFKISLKRDRSFYLSVKVSAVKEMVNRYDTLTKGLEERIREGRWDKDWVVVTSLVLSENYFWTTSKKRGAEVIAECDVEGVKTAEELANLPKAHFKVCSRSENTVTCFPQEEGEDIFGFHLMQLKRSHMRRIARPSFGGMMEMEIDLDAPIYEDADELYAWEEYTQDEWEDDGSELA